MEKGSSIKLIFQLTRFNMSAAIAFSSLAGYIFYMHGLTPGAVFVFCAVLLLAGAATALNQYQERNLDAMMSRTKNRPLVTGELKPKTALWLALGFAISGLLILYFLTTPVAAFLGLFNILWYNAVYTPLKRKTAFVVIVGAVTGAIPPLMGWTAAGGNLSDPEILFIASFFFIWQIPHFFLLLLRYKDDYKKAGFASVINFMNERQVKSIVFVWVLGTSAITLFFPLFHVISGAFLITCIIILNLLLIVIFYRSAFQTPVVSNMRSAFGSLYLYQILILAILIAQALK